jgi:Tol biopolymer transport system component
MIGTKLAHYEITSHLGSGGMGDVYEATDSKLGRSVAIKFLPEAFSHDTERVARFEREARVLASLNHSNIAAIHGLEESAERKFLVMELVEGETLAERIKRGPIPVDESLAFAKQISEALEAAHETGIIHRDLKPANVKITPGGKVKVLDFGLAKAFELEGSKTNMSQSPTLSITATNAGVILGTAAYMSPEQARGKVVDRRADIWAFGVLLFEMLTGTLAFGDEDVSMTLSKVLQREPNFDALPRSLPARVNRVLRVCLCKDPKQRVGDIRDVRLALEGAFETPAPATGDASGPAKARFVWMWLALTAIVTSGVTGLVVWSTVHAPAPPPVRRLQHMLPRTLELPVASGTLVALSPDGRTLVYRAREEGGVWRLYRRTLDVLDATPISGTEGSAQSPFFSPDGQWVGFTAPGSNTLMKVPLAGGRPVRIGSMPVAPRGASWGLDGTIIVGANASGLMRVPASGGDAVPLAAPDDGRQYWYPQILPGGRAVLFTASETVADAADVLVLDLKTGVRQTVVKGGAAGWYVPTGHIVFLRGGDLWAVRFDPEQLQVSGEPVLVEQGIRVEIGGAVQFALADDGTLTYITADVSDTLRSLVWVDRTGHEERLSAPERAYSSARISPDGTRVAVGIDDQERDIWTWHLTGQTLTRLTFDPLPDTAPLWSPDGRRIIFASGNTTTSSLYWRAADGTGAVERLTKSPNGQIPNAITSDGTQILLREVAPTTGTDLMRMSVPPTSPSSKLGEPTPLLQTKFAERNAELAPGGQWLAYESNESGRLEIYVRPFPNVDGGRWQVSTSGGRTPLWSRDGQELFYVSPEDALMAVRVERAQTWRSGMPTRVLQSPNFFVIGVRTFDIAPDGRRFLMIKNSDTTGRPQASIVVVQNWFEELKRLVPMN